MTLGQLVLSASGWLCHKPAPAHGQRDRTSETALSRSVWLTLFIPKSLNSRVIKNLRFHRLLEKWSIRGELPFGETGKMQLMNVGFKIQLDPLLALLEVAALARARC